MADNFYSGLVISLVARLISIASSLVMIWAFNLVGRDVYGVYAFAGSLAAIVVVIGCFGLDQLMLFRQSQNRPAPLLGLLAASLVKVTGISIAASMLFLLFGFLQTSYLEPSDAFPVYLAFALTIPAVAGTNVFAAMYQARQDFGKALLIPRSTEMLRLAVIVPLGFFMADVDFYLLVIVVSAWIPLVLYRMDIGVLPGGGSAIDSAGKKYAGHMVMVSLVRSGVDNIDIIMVGLLTTLSSTAAYAIASRLASFALLGNQLLGQVTLPRIGSAIGESNFQGMMSEFDRHRWSSMLVVLAVSIMLMLFGMEVLGVFGNYADALPVMYVLLGAHIFACSFGPVGNALKMGGHADKLLSSVWVLLLLLFATNLVFIPLLGIVGAALGTLFSLVMINLLNWWQCRRVYGIWTTGPMALSVMLAGNAGILLFALGQAVAGVSLAGTAMIIALAKVMRGGVDMKKTVGF